MSFSFPFCLLINANFCFYKCLSLSFFFFLSFYYILFPYRSIFLLFYLELHLPRLSKFSPRGYNCYLGKVFAKQTDSKSLSRSKLTFTLKKKMKKLLQTISLSPVLPGVIKLTSLRRCVHMKQCFPRFKRFDIQFFIT
jgi:hypothetical protein